MSLVYCPVSNLAEHSSNSTLQPDDGKLHHAAKLAQDGDHHDPKKGQAKREQEKSESGGKKPMAEQEIVSPRS